MGTNTATLPSVQGREEALERSVEQVLCRGRCLGRYRLLFPVGSGGMAHVWAAARSGDYGFERLFAVKVMREDIAHIASFRKMFLEEAKLASRIHHTNVVEVIDLGEEAGTVYQVMPLLEGDSLAGLIREWRAARVPLGAGARVMVDVLRGLHAAHEMKGDGGAPLGIVHRDVSPQNILVGIDGVSKIADFGVAKVVGSFLDETPGAPKGKIAYMAPEQLENTTLDRRCDVFAAGVVLWELLAGRRLAPSAASSLLAGSTLEDLGVSDAGVPRELAEVAMRALERWPRDRFPSADAMADALEDAARACGLALSTKEVASWAARLTAARLAKRRGEMVEAATLLSSGAVATSRRRGRKTWPLGVAAFAMGVGGAAAVWMSASAASGKNRDLRAAASTAVAVPLAAPGPPSVPLEPKGVAVSALIDDSSMRLAPPEAPAVASSRAAQPPHAPAVSARTPPSRQPEPREAAPPRPKFANPYVP